MEGLTAVIEQPRPMSRGGFAASGVRNGVAVR